MIRTAFQIACLLAVVCLCEAASAQSTFGRGARGPEATGRAGVDIAIGAEAMSMQSNPAGLARQKNNRSDLSGFGHFDKLDWVDRNGVNYNGDQPFFSGHFAYAFLPNQLYKDPLTAWSDREESLLEKIEGRAKFEGTLEVVLERLPKKIAVLGSGTGMWVSDFVLRGHVRSERRRLRFYPRPLPGLPRDAKPKEIRAEFKYRLSNIEPGVPPSLSLHAYGRTETILLKADAGAWADGTISLLLDVAGPSPRISFTAMTEGGKVELKSLAFLRIVHIDGKDLETRDVVDDADLSTREDPGSGTVIIASDPSSYQLSGRERDLWTLEEPDRFKGDEISDLVLEFHYGFDGAGSSGKLAMLIDGQEAASHTFRPREEVAPDTDLMAENRRKVAWLEKEKLHVGFGAFTSGWIAAGYANTPSDIGVHEGQLRYSSYSPCIAVAGEIHPAVSLGASIDLVHGRFFNFDGVFAQPAEILGDFSADYTTQTGRDHVTLQMDANDLTTYGVTGRIGLLAEVVENLQVGTVFTPPGYLGRHGGRASVDFSDDFEASGFDTWLQANAFLPVAGTDFNGEYDAYVTGLRLPPHVGIGVSWQPIPEIQMALDVEYIGWGQVMDHLTVKFTRGSNPNSDHVTGRTFEARIPFKMKDQFAAGLGFSFHLAPEFTLHAGYRWQSPAMEASSAHPLFPATVSHTVALGFSFKHRNLGLHIAVQHGFDEALDTGASDHAAFLSDADFTIRREFATVGISYEY